MAETQGALMCKVEELTELVAARSDNDDDSPV